MTARPRPARCSAADRPGQAGAHHDHVVGRARDGAHHAARSVQADGHLGQRGSGGLRRIACRVDAASSARVDALVDQVFDPLQRAAWRRSGHATARRRRRSRSVGAHQLVQFARASASASWWAATTTLVALRSARSLPIGFPVTAGEPKMPNTSSRIWKASPIASP